LPNVPFATDLARTQEQRQILDFVVSSEVLGRPFVAPPGIPADRREALRKAFYDTMKDPAFLADAKKMLIDINPASGQEVDAIIASLYAIPKDVVKQAVRAVN
jgi:tripartite-type tricarboxylate transporter receptor subunit TctC